MSALDPSQVTSRANSDLCSIELILSQSNIDPAVRMEWILKRAMDYNSATLGSVGRYSAIRKAADIPMWPHLR